MEETIASLREEIEKLKEENKFLKKELIGSIKTEFKMLYALIKKTKISKSKGQ